MRKNFIKLKCFTLILAVTLIVVSSCKTTNNIYFPKKNNDNIAADAEFLYAAENLEQLYEFSDSVVIGNIVDEGNISSEYFYKTVSATLEITKCIKGKFTEGQKITVAEFGVRNEDGTDYSIGGVPLLKTGMRVILFLEQPKELYENSNEYIYAPLNAYLGKFFYDNKEIIHPSTDFATADVLKLNDFDKPLKESEVLNSINKVVKKTKDQLDSK